MAFELKEGQGTLHINDKEGVEKRPDRTGKLNIGGVIYKLSGWLKEGPSGYWLSLEASIPQPKDKPAPKAVDDQDRPF